MSDITKHPIMGKQCKCSLMMSEHGHDCHPMWREHHGPMEGFEYVGNPLEIGDEWIGPEPVSKWSKIPNCFAGDVLPKDSHCAYRRRIAPIPEAPKRFVTVVYEVTPDVIGYIETLKAFKERVEIREGNYLDKFDGMEQNVIEAMRKGKV